MTLVASASAMRQSRLSLGRDNARNMLIRYPTAQSRRPCSRSPSLHCHASLSPDVVFNIATLGVMPFYALMIGAPQNPITKRLMSSRIPYYAAAAFYAALLGLWDPLVHLWAVFKSASLTGGLPNVVNFAASFSSPEATTLSWLHLVTLDLFQAR